MSIFINIERRLMKELETFSIWKGFQFIFSPIQIMNTNSAKDLEVSFEKKGSFLITAASD